MDRLPSEMSSKIFEEEIMPLKDKLYRYALRILKNGPEAEDVIQDILVKVWNKRDLWHTWDNKEAMCMTMTRNLSIDRSRSKSRQTTDLPEHYDEESPEADPSEITESNDTMALIQKIMDDLPQKQREVIHLREIDGYSYQEISEVLSMSMSQVKINVHRARLFMKERIMQEYGEGFHKN